MTDREPGGSGELSESEVSALLASLGDAEPLPEDVGDRLDETLAALVRERQDESATAEPGADEPGADEPGADETGADDGPATVVPLRRRRAARGLLVAAALLGVVGIGAAVTEGVLGDLTGEDADSATAGDAASDAGSDAGGESAPKRERATQGEADSGADSGPEQSTTDSLTDLPRDVTALRALRDVSTQPELRSAVRAVGRQQARELDAPDEQRSDLANAAKAARCAVPRVAGTTASVRYDGEPATLVVRREAGVLEGRVYSCSLGLLLDSTRVRLGTPAE